MANLKRKMPEVPMIVNEVSSGREIMTQVVYAIEYLREKDRAISFQDIWQYLSIPQDQQRHRPALLKALMAHPKVEHIPNKQGGGGQHMFRFKPMHNVRNGDELVAYLQSQKTAQGISVKELRDGWNDAHQTIEALEKNGVLLVTHNKKDNSPKMVWLNDTSLTISVDDDFKQFWTNLRLPTNDSDMRSELERAGLTPTSQVKEAIKLGPQKKEKRRINRKAGRSTNTHMNGILKDYSFKK
ncbi:transcription initiation factor IIE subunit beta [Elsinoe australis]|uniref:Transcription initiation factor IIE subunit beta n=1 Tax=Elsinoe australis TaxID=40998 RepID=A0A4U7ATG0_9PEZI|nr:transcription initiation factor IIE subunit beta [Elsinoe australis]